MTPQAKAQQATSTAAVTESSQSGRVRSEQAHAAATAGAAARDEARAPTTAVVILGPRHAAGTDQRPASAARILRLLNHSAVTPDMVVLDPSVSYDGADQRQPRGSADHGRPGPVVVTAEHSLGLADDQIEHILATVTERGGAPPTFLWFLRPTDSPDSKALGALLQAAAQRPDAAIVGPKVVAGNDRDSALVSIGYATTPYGRIVANAAGNEHDQGQHDHLEDVQAVAPSGLLLRVPATSPRGAARALTSTFGQAVDCAAMARAAGSSVLVVPASTVQSSQDPQLPADDAARLALAGASSRLFALRWVFAVLGALMRLVGRTLIKDPARGWRDARSISSALFDVKTLRSMRDRRQRARTTGQGVPRRSDAELRLSTIDTLRFHRDRFSASFRSEASPSDKVWQQAGSRRWAVPLLLGGVFLILGQVIAALVTGGGARLPARLGEGLASADLHWAAYRRPFTVLGAAEDVPGDPAQIAYAAFAAVSGGSTAIGHALLLGGPFVVAVLVAWWALLRAPTTLWRASLSVLWACNPALVWLVVSGAGVAAWAVALIPLGAVAVVPRRSQDSRSHTAASYASAGLRGALITVFHPGVGLLVALGILVRSLLHIRTHRTLVFWGAVAALLSISPAVPLLLAAVRGGTFGAIFASPAVATAVPTSPAWNWLLGVGNHPEPVSTAGSVALWVTYALGAAALTAAVIAAYQGLRAARRDIGWVVAAVVMIPAGLIMASLAVRIPVAPYYDGKQVMALTADPTPFVGVCAWAVVMLVATWPLRLRAQRAVWSQVSIAGLTVALVMAGPLAVVLASSWKLPPTGGDSLPLVARNSLTAEHPSRVVQIDVAGQALYLQVLGRAGNTLAGTNATSEAYSADGNPQSAFADELRTLAGNMISTSNSPIPQLDALGIAYVSVVTGSADDHADDSPALTDAADTGGTGPDAEVSGTDRGTGWDETTRGTQDAPALSEVAADLTDAVRATAGLQRATADVGRAAWRVLPALEYDGAFENTPSLARVMDTRGAGSWVSIDQGPWGVEDTVSGAEQPRIVVLSMPADDRWSATLDGEVLESAEYGPVAAFALPPKAGVLRIHYTDPTSQLILALQIVFLAFMAMVAIPSARGVSAAALRRRKTTSAPAVTDRVLDVAAHDNVEHHDVPTRGDSAPSSEVSR